MAPQKACSAGNIGVSYAPSVCPVGHSEAVRGKGMLKAFNNWRVYTPLVHLARRKRAREFLLACIPLICGVTSAASATTLNRGVKSPLDSARVGRVLPAGVASSTSPASTIVQVVVVHSGQQTNVRVEAKGHLSYRTFRLKNPERLVLDFSGARLAVTPTSIPSDLKPVRRVRLGQFTPDVARVVIELEQLVPYSLKEEGNTVSVALGAASEVSASGPVTSKTIAGQEQKMASARRAPVARPLSAQPDTSDKSRMRLPESLTQRLAIFGRPRVKVGPALLQGIVRELAREPGAIGPRGLGRPVGGASITLRYLATGELCRLPTGKICQATTDVEGVFRLRDVPPGRYALTIEREGYEPYSWADLRLNPGEVVTLIPEPKLKAIAVARAPALRVPVVPALRPPEPPAPEPAPPPILPYQDTLQRLETASGAEEIQPEVAPPLQDVSLEMPDRWDIPMPEWDRYGKGGEFPYVKGHWYDPFNRNKLKGDVPIFGQRTFFNLTASSETFLDGRRLPVPSNVSAARPGSAEFFGRGEQLLALQTFRFSLDLFRGDTSFRPIDWRVRVTPAVNVNYIATRELGIVNIDVRRGTNRLDSQASLQEAFFELKLRDLSTNYDFLSVRAGIQPFTSDFRGFLFVEEQPGVRIFGNLHSNRWEYNLAYFHFLEKDTNSGLNTFRRRHQQVIIANLYRQDFIWPGYTAQFSVHYNKDDASLHFDENDFLVRPAPFGFVRSSNQLRPHNIRAAYLGWTGNGHIGRLNVSHAFYQALGIDDFNLLANRRVTINAQMAALELSIDKDWARLRGSFFWASGSANPSSGRARGFDAIVDLPAFAGGIFSLWNREGIRLTGSGVALTTPNSLLPSLRSSKEEGQANFVNPGIFLYNAGMDIEVTPKLRSFINVNLLRFDRTEPLQLLLFQGPIRHNIGVDYSLGFQYRPPLTENIILTGGASALSPGQGFRDIYTGKTLFSLFGNVRFLF